jgi:galactonate dehydratase
MISRILRNSPDTASGPKGSRQTVLPGTMTPTPEPFQIAQTVFSEIPVRGGTHWYFAELSNPDGVTGLAEFTFGEQSVSVSRAIAQMTEELEGVPIVSDTNVAEMLGLSEQFLQRDRVLAAAVSAIRTALLDAQAQIAGIPLWRLLGGDSGAPVPLYANINRALSNPDSGPGDRSPGAFAAVAARAIEEGFRTIKCAPFDECRAPFGQAGLPDEALPGLARISAVREAIGPQATLLVDCHSRFDLESARALEPLLAERGVGWYEEPVSYRTHRRELAGIREFATMDVAGAEDGYGLSTFDALLRDAVVDVVMPDIKYCGGAGEAVLIGRSLEKRHPGGVSMHSPSGPASMLASAHATAAFGGVRPLEHAVWEADWRSTVLEPAENIHDGDYHLPGGPGLGASLNQALISERGRRWAVA